MGTKTWIDKTLQINSGSYGILCISTSDMRTKGFDLQTFSYTDCGGKHQHNNFTLTLAKAHKVASTLYRFGTTKQKIEPMILEQEHSTRGRLLLRMFTANKLDLSIDSYMVNSGQLSLSRKQAKKLAGYIYFWIGESLIGTRRIKKKATSWLERDLNDITQKR